MQPNDRFKVGKGLAALVAILVLGGCVGGVRNSVDMAPNIDRRFPIELSSSIKTQTLDMTASQASLTRAQRAQMDVFVRKYLRGGRGPMDIVVAGARKDDPTALARGAMVRQALLRAGMMRHEIRVQVAMIGDAAKGPVVLSFKAYRAQVRNCGDMSSAHTFNPHNRSYSNLGCALQTNRAAMVSNPGDLASSRPEVPTDSRRRGRYVEGYKAGN